MGRGGGGGASGIGASLPKNDAQLKHIFRKSKKGGHFENDTLENRRLILDTVKNIENYVGKKPTGNEWYARILDDGRQIWAEVRDGTIRNAGYNDPPITSWPFLGGE
jgi:hypothetical protein